MLTWYAGSKQQLQRGRRHALARERMRSRKAPSDGLLEEAGWLRWPESDFGGVIWLPEYFRHSFVVEGVPKGSSDRSRRDIGC